MQQRVLRIPSKHYQDALSQLQELGTILALEQSSEDVTEAFSDVVRRIENLRALQARYTQLLAAANSIQVRLAIEKELRRISQELRELEERRRSLVDRIAYATITLELEAKPKHRVAHSGRVQPFPFVDDYGLSSVLR
jgi:vacuolar-type H+-ATPase subunit I/STV1